MMKDMGVKTILLLASYFYLPVSHALTLNGYTGFIAILEINASTSGIVKSVDVKAGQRIKKGDVLIQLDSTPQKAKLKKAQAIEKSLLPAVDSARIELERALELYDRDSLSQVELKNSENLLAEKEGAYQAAQSETTLAQYQLGNTVIHSPVDGRVLQVFTNVAQYVDPAVNPGSLISLVESRQMKAVALVNSDQWDPELINKKATVAYRHKTFNGKVSFIGYKRIKQTSGLPAYEIYVTFETDKLIPAEMPVSIEINN